MKKNSQTELNLLIKNHNLHLETISDVDKKGQRLILDEVDFTDNDLSELNFVEAYISSSLFKSQMFENTNFGGAELYDCIFKNMVFKDCDFGKTTLNYAKIMNSKFLDCNLVDLETVESNFEELLFENCILNGAFSNCDIKNVVFKECTFVSTEFWRCAIESLKFSAKKTEWDFKKLIEEVNIGTTENPIFIRGQEAIEYFESKCIVY